MRILLVALVALVALGSVHTLPCDTTTLELVGSRMMVRQTGTTVTAFPVGPDSKPILDKVSVGLQLSVVTERKWRASPKGGHACVLPRLLSPLFTPPDLTVESETGPKGEQYGTFISKIDLKDFSCESVKDTLYPIAEDGKTAKVDRIRLNLTHPDTSLRMQVIYELPNKSFLKDTNYNTQYTQGEPYKTYYRYVAH